MIDQEALLQDFFIYVPDVSVPDQSTNAHVESSLCANVPPGQNNAWIKIPLTEEFYVYARVLPEDQSAVVCC
jgi:hypothetical protein